MADPRWGDTPPFDCAPGLRLAAHERLIDVRLEAIHRRLERMEGLMEKFERRIWLTVYGVAAAVLAQAFQSFLTVSIP